MIQIEGCGKTYTHPSSLRKHLKAHETAGDIKDKADSVSSGKRNTFSVYNLTSIIGGHSPINNSSASSNLSDDGTRLEQSRDRLPSFERIQDGLQAPTSLVSTLNSSHSPDQIQVHASSFHQIPSIAAYNEYTAYAASTFQPEYSHYYPTESSPDPAAGSNPAEQSLDLNLSTPWTQYTNWANPTQSY